VDRVADLIMGASAMTKHAGWAVPLSGMFLFGLLLSLLPACGQSSSPPDQPSASATLLVQQNTESNSLIPAGRSVWDPEKAVTNQIAYLESEEIRIGVLESPEVQATQWYQAFDGDKAKALDELGDMLLAEPEQGTGLIHLTLTADDGEEAKAILTQWIAVFLRAVEREQGNNHERSRRAYQVELDSAFQEIINVSADIQVFELRNPRAIADEQLSDKTRTLLLLTDQRNEAMVDLAGAQAYSDMMLGRSESETSEPTRDEIEIIEQSEAVRGLRAQIQQLEGAANAENQIQTLGGELEVEIEKLVREIIAGKLEDARLSVLILQERTANLDPQIVEVQNHLQAISRLQVERDSLNRRLQNAEDRAARARERLADIEIINARTVTVTLHTPPKINQP